MQGSDISGRAPRRLDTRAYSVIEHPIGLGIGSERRAAPSHLEVDDRAIRVESRGPRQTHKMRARFGRRWRFAGHTVPIDTLAALRTELYGYTNPGFGRKLEAARILHAMPVRDVRMALAGLTAWSRTQPVAEARLGIIVYDPQTQAMIHDSTAMGREHQRQRAKVQAIFDATRGNSALQVWHRLDGHARHCACHGCGRLDKAVRALGNFIRGS